MSAMRFENHTARRLASRASQLVLPTLLSVALFSSTAIGTEPGGEAV